MKVAVVNPPFMDGKFSRTSRSPAIVKSGTMYWPFWLAYAVGTLERAGHQVLFFDCPAENITRRELMSKLQEESPAMIVLDTSTPSIHSDLSVAKEISELLPEASLFLVGTHASARPADILLSAPYITGIAAREYDFTIPEIADALQSKNDLQQIPGLWLNTPDKPFFTGAREPISDLDSLPMLADVYLKHLKPENYFFAAARYPSVMIITSRGCPFKCSYCVWPQVLHGGTYRSRSAQNVVEEFMKVQEFFPQVQEIVFEDDTFSVDSSRVAEVSEALIAAGNKLPWTANTRANLSLEAMKKMRNAGCRMIIVGYESGNQSILNGVSKGTTIEQNLSFAKRAKQAGLLVHGCFMAGNPGETRKTLEETLEMAIRLKPDTAQFFPIMAYPGTRLYEQYRSSGNLKTEDYREWLTEEGLHNCVVDLPDLSSEDIVEWCAEARRKFYLRPEYILYKAIQTVLHPTTEGRRTIRAFSTFRKHLFRRN
ncbi:MAG: radical SAM protein [Candidatus Sabulitectum sp.]|nr:radical SAM protein [Candidatus Sabulitectum sp.]